MPQMEGSDLVRGVTAPAAFDWPAEDPDEFGVAPEKRAKRRLKIAAYDFGMKWNILRRLSAHGCDVRVYPATTPASELLASKPDGVFLSNGPGDPAPLAYAIENAKTLVDANVPVFGICLGHQILGLAMGGTTYKLKFGHRGANHPVKQLATGNPATIMTDPELADRTYVEPLTVEVLDAIIARERPDALLPTVGGQTALNLAVDLAAAGVLEKYNVELIGASITAIKVAEDRQLFKDAMRELGPD